MLSIYLLLSVVSGVAGAEPVFSSNDVIALIGGEDIVAMGESGELEAQIIRQPGLASVKVRSLSFEGDTVFEQHRMLNYPSWEEQLNRIAATVVMVQFGQMEALRKDSSVDDFVAHYEALLKRFAGGDRRLVILSPTPFEKPAAPLPDLTAKNAELENQLSPLRALADKLNAAFVDFYRSFPDDKNLTRDGIHLNDAGREFVAREIVRQLRLKPIANNDPGLMTLLREKNRLYFYYHRPQNWAFLHGDRTEQPSSRDWRNPSIRWFPTEMEEYVPLIAAKEKEIVEHLRDVQVQKN